MTPIFDHAWVPFDAIRFDDPLFDSIKADYPEFNLWREHALLTKVSRRALVVYTASGGYAGMGLVKYGEGPDGPSQFAMKISTLKVADCSKLRGVADFLLSQIVADAFEKKISVVFLTVPQSHEDLCRYLELRGFRRGPKTASSQEFIYIADFADPERVYSAINRLAYDILAQDYLARSQTPGCSQESPEYLANLLLDHVAVEQPRILELGPGSGDVLRVLAKSSLHALAVEISPEMARIASLAAPTATIVVADLLFVDFPAGSFDAIYAGAFIHLFPKSVATNIVGKISNWLTPEGAAFINTSIGSSGSEAIELKTDYLYRVARFRSRWTESEFRSMIEANALTVIDRATTNEIERGKYWVAYVCAKNRR